MVVINLREQCQFTEFFPGVDVFLAEDGLGYLRFVRSDLRALFRVERRQSVIGSGT